jgi:hypothetical protein
MMKAEVERALAQIRSHFSDASVQAREDGDGGAYVIVDPIDLGPLYTDETRHSWIGFRITFQYPLADVYPHHIRPDLKRLDDQPHGQGMGVTRFEGEFARESLQLSRRTKEVGWANQSALLKLQKVIDWVRTRS